MRFLRTPFFLLVSVLWLLPLSAGAQENPVDYVDPRIGASGDDSNCNIGPQLPFGSINPAPETPNSNQNGYNPAQPIRGFGQLHVSGIGWTKYGEVFVSPQVGLAVGELEHDSPKADEVVCPYRYGVTLTRYAVRAEVAPAMHSAIYRFTFPETDAASVIIDATHNIPMDIVPYVGGKVSYAFVSVDSARHRISGGGRYEGGFGAAAYNVYFSAEFTAASAGCGTWLNGKISSSKTAEFLMQANDRVGGYFEFHTAANVPVQMKIAVSLKSVDQAAYWLEHEIPGWNFDEVSRAAETAWNRALGKIRVGGGDSTAKKLFYTALYHSMLMPHNRTGDIPGFADTVQAWDDQYAVWDTWRTMFPLMLLIQPDMVRGNIRSFVARLKKNGMVKDSFIGGVDMIEEQGGNDVDNIIADARVKKLDGVLWDDAYAVMKHNADFDRLGFQGFGNAGIVDSVMASYKVRGWIPAGNMSCSKTLEYAYNDFCAAEVALSLNRKEDFEKYLGRSKRWTNLWNPEAVSDGFKGFITPKDANDAWVPFDPRHYWASWKEYFYEGSSWTYSYFVPHQFSTLVKLSGGKEIFAAKLTHGLQDTLIDFSNEPAFLAVQTFQYAGRPDLASFWVRKLAKDGFTLIGVPGNDDSGAMSSWYAFTAMGFFPNAGQPIYYLTGPMWKKVSVELENGKTLRIDAPEASEKNIYVQSCEVNGKKWNHSWIDHRTIMDGASIKFEMGPNPSAWGQNDSTLVDGVDYLLRPQ
ncbi:MAG TPA: GH92 family glycosyl hydrolase [Bacteroidota bacterium]|nr:GH92 family glycosyl hydrolase [Bacteroidota bacterium]